ncbi:hypothetical protein JKF63_03830 [Porcisia hertigi]|uniref:Uncharacterized protein n=1 Tax=Porcisia hertigi TaxID=2761500 RepID=A0A836HR10_9TRYP|nr:hypothetical protein JKF63_03830 [Porcisia hertigi]
MSSITPTDMLSRLNRTKEPADLIYSKDALQVLGGAAPPPLAESPISSPYLASPNDEYSVLLARKIGTIVARLNELSSPVLQAALTPRMILLELMDILREALYGSLPEDIKKDVSPADKSAVVTLFNWCVSSRRVPIDCAIEGLYVISYVSVKLRVELVMLQLRRRLEEELFKKRIEKADASTAALLVTLTLLDDLVILYNSIMLTVPITKGAVHERSADETVRRLAPVYPHYFYQLCDWMLVLEVTMNTTPISYTQIKQMSIDEANGIVVIDMFRPKPETPLGLLLNEQGALVDVDVSLRIFEKGKELHDLLRSAPQGAFILKVGEKPVGSVVQGDYAAYKQRLLKVLHSTTTGRRRVQILLKSSGFKAEARSLPLEVAFLAPPQGGEGTSGHRVTFVLRRQSATAEWGFTVDEQLYWQLPTTHFLSEPAKSFMQECGSHLRLLAVNGVEALHVTQVQLLVESAEIVVLELLVMPKYGQERRIGSHSAVQPKSSSTKTPAVEAPCLSAADLRHKMSSDNSDGSHMEVALIKFLQKRASLSTSISPAAGGADKAIEGDKPLVDACAVGPAPTAAAAVVAAQGVKMDGQSTGKPNVLEGSPAEATVSQGAMVSRPVADAQGTASPSVEATTQSEEVTEAATATMTGSGKDESEGSHPHAPEWELSEPCTFDNDVKLTAFGENEMVLERPSLDTPWGLAIGRLTTPDEAPQMLPLRLMNLPAGRKVRVRQHPFYRSFKMQPSSWYIAEVNGAPASDAEATLKRMSQLTRMTLRFLRK